MHLTYLSVDSIQEGVGSSQILPLLLAYRAKNINVDLISFEKDKPTKEFVDYINESGINWKYSIFKKGSFFHSLIRIRKMKKLISDTDIIHARSDLPAISAIIYRNAPILWDFRSFWFLQRTRMASNNLERFFFGHFGFIEKLISRKVTGISTLSRSALVELQNQGYKLPAVQIVVPTNVDLQHFKFHQSMPEKCTALFSGTYNSNYDLDKTVQFVNQFKNIVKCDVLWARPKETTRSKFDSYDLDTIEATRKEMPKIISKSSFGIAICKEEDSVALRAAMPTKIAEFFSVGRPVVVSEGIGDLDSIISSHRVGVVIPKGDWRNLREVVEKLIEILDDPETPFRCRKVAEDLFDLNQGVDTYLSALFEIRSIS